MNGGILSVVSILIKMMFRIHVIAVRLFGEMLRVLHIVCNLKSIKMEMFGDCMLKLQTKHGIAATLILIKCINYVNRLQIYQRGSDRYINEFRMECILL